MFSKKLFKTALAASGLFFIAATPANHLQLTNQLSLLVKDTCIADSSLKVNTHRFDETGICICLPELTTEQLQLAPRIVLSKHTSGFVQSYIQKNKYGLGKIKAKSTPYFNTIDKVFTSYDLPVELKYLAVIESRLNPNIVSRVGAVGLWQFMPASAKRFGLKTNGVDERRNSYKSSVAAARYISYLNKIFDDWLLTIAAYNSGPAPVLAAIKKSGSRDFWKLEGFLPLETRKHIKKFIATHYYFEGHGSLVTMTKKEATAHDKAVEEFVKRIEQPKTDSLIIKESIQTVANNQPGR
jgi:membrane-bound lytic murein transglycosylase D